MNPALPRRSFLRSSAAIAVGAACGDFGLPGRLPRVAAADAIVDPRRVQFRPEIEPLVRLLEETPRDRLLEEVGARVRRGTTFREVVTGLLLAGIRNIQPRPVGFKFHAVLVVNSAVLASQNSPDADRWLPIFWALDQFKSSQARDVEEGDWTMDPVDEKTVPEASKACGSFKDAMDAWDSGRADTAAAGLARGVGASDIFDLLCRYGARDFRDIGHKAIYVANAWRTLHLIGWQHAEPVIRSLAYALLEHEGDSPAGRDAEPDRPGRRHADLVGQIRAGWTTGEARPDATVAMLATLRGGTWEQAGDKVVELLNAGTDPQSIWDALFAAAGELLMRRPGIASLHACTTTNALRYAFIQAGQDETRRFLLLQNAAFIPMFRARAGVDAANGVRIDAFDAEPTRATGTESVAEIFADVSHDRDAAARKALGWLKDNQDPRAFVDAAQRLIYLKGTDSHDYKFSSAVLEDFGRLSNPMRDRYLAASVYWLKGSEGPDNNLVTRARAAI